MKQYILTLLALCCSAIPTLAAETLSLERCRQLAVENSKKLNSRDEKIEASKDLLSAYKSNYLPNFSLSGSYLYSTISFSETITGGNLPLFNLDGTQMAGFAYMPDINYELEMGSIYNVAAQLTQPIYMGGKISNAVKLAHIGVSISEMDRVKSESEVIISADEAFYNLLKVSEMLLSANKYQEVVEEFYRQMTSAYNNGMSRKNELLKVEVRLNEAKLLTQKAENGVRLAKMNLCYAIGLPLSTTDITLVDDFDSLHMVDPTELDVTSRPEYAMLKSQIEAKELEAKISRGDYMPSVTALASYSYTNGVKLNGNTLFNNAGFTGGVSVNVPIFHWGEGRRKTSAKRREITIAQNQMEDLSQQMTLELLQAINAYNESILEVQLSEESVAQAEENMRLSGNQYNAGMETLAEHLEAQALWQRAMSELTASRSKHRIAYTKYLKSKGEL